MTPGQDHARRPSDEANEEQLRLAKEQGEALQRAIDEMTKSEAYDGGEQRAGDYLIGYAVEEAEGLYHLWDGRLGWQEPEHENVHVEVAVRDGADGRFIPGLEEDHTIQEGQFYLADFRDDPKFQNNQPHLFLQKGEEFQEPACWSPGGPSSLCSVHRPLLRRGGGDRVLGRNDRLGTCGDVLLAQVHRRGGRGRTDARHTTLECLLPLSLGRDTPDRVADQALRLVPLPGTGLRLSSLSVLNRLAGSLLMGLS